MPAFLRLPGHNPACFFVSIFFMKRRAELMMKTLMGLLIVTLAMSACTARKAKAGGKEALIDLLKELRAPVAADRALALDKIEAMGEPGIDALIGALSNDYPDVRAGAA